MSLRASYYLLILAEFIVVISTQSCGIYNNSWFGVECQYKCHCKNDEACNVTNGDCPNGCDIGWFGPACQYVDLARDATIKHIGDVSQDMKLFTDGDDTTCATLTANKLSLNVTWDYDVYITWLRIVVSNDALLPVNISINFPGDLPTQNSKCVKVFVDKLTTDIYCNNLKPVRALVLNGSGVQKLCSLYFSKGRNVALKQLTNQTSTDNVALFYVSSSAVDGNKGTFTHTNVSGEVAPTWTLMFLSPVTVKSYTIYNRIQPDQYRTLVLNRLKSFILRSFDQTNKIVQSYKDREPLGLEVYNVLSTDPWAQVSYVQITATNPSNTIILSLSEVEIFGESVCPGETFLYGRNCENLCNCDVPDEKCFVSTGNCPSGCKAGYYGQGCNKQCETGYFGIDCQNYCSSNCSGQQCDGINGKCLSCALKGRKLPYCSDYCEPGSYGIDCKLKCSLNCVQTGAICDVIKGKCLGCKTGFYGNNCTTPCSTNCKDSKCDISTGNCASCKPGYYGMTCDNLCSKNCKDSLCEINSGMCISCSAGFKGSQCNQDCNYYTYGENCTLSCSPNCNINFTNVRYCDVKDGHCLNGCRSGYEGADCVQVAKLPLEDADSTEFDRGLASGIGIGIGITIAGGIVIGIVIFICLNRSQTPPTKPPSTITRPYDRVDPIHQNEHDYQTVDKSGDGYDLITDVVFFNKKTDTSVVGVAKQNYENISCIGVSQ